MVKAIESRISARLPPTVCWIEMAVAISSRSSDRTRRTMFSSACSNGRPRLTSRMTRPNSSRDRRSRLADDELDRLEERRAGAERVREQGDRVRELLVEGVEAAALAPAEPEPRQEEAEEHADEQRDRGPQGRDAEREDDHAGAGTPTIEAGPDGEELARLELEVGAGEVAGEVRAEVALLDDLVELGERALDEISSAMPPPADVPRSASLPEA